MYELHLSYSIELFKRYELLLETIIFKMFPLFNFKHSFSITCLCAIDSFKIRYYTIRMNQCKNKFIKKISQHLDRMGQQVKRFCSSEFDFHQTPSALWKVSAASDLMIASDRPHKFSSAHNTKLSGARTIKNYRINFNSNVGKEIPYDFFKLILKQFRLKKK